MPFITQRDVDVAINYFIDHAIAFEELRDAQVWESPLYWHYHDAAINLHLSAEALMP
jgi:hypothetical protein